MWVLPFQVFGFPASSEVPLGHSSIPTRQMLNQGLTVDDINSTLQ